MRALLVLSSATMLGGLALAVPALGEANPLQFPQMLPGQYEETIQFVSHSDNAPPELVARFDDKKPFVRKFCYKRDLQDPLSPSLIQFRAGRDCAPVSATVDGAGAAGKFSCDGSGYTGELAYTGTFTPTTADLKMDVAMRLPRQAQPLTIQSTHTIRRVAESCTGS